MKRVLLSVFFAVSSLSYAITDFELPWVNHPGQETVYKSTAHPNAVFVIEAFFNGCYYCNENAPNVETLANKFAMEPHVQVLDVGIDKADSEYQDWINKHEPEHPVLKDASRKLIKQFGTTGYPSTYVVNCKGEVKYSSSGEWTSTTMKSIENAVIAALDTKCVNEEPNVSEKDPFQE